MDRKKLNEILDKHVQKFFAKAPTARFDDVPSETFIDAMEEAINYSQCCTPKGTVKTIDFERTIDLLDAEIDSLKDSYHQETIVDRKTVYSSMILESLHAKKKLKQ